MKRCSKWNVIVPLCLVLSETVSLSEQSFKCSAQQPQTCSVWSRSSVDGEQVRSLTFSRNVNPSVLHGPCVKGLSDWYWALWEHGPVCVCVFVFCVALVGVCVYRLVVSCFSFLSIRLSDMRWWLAVIVLKSLRHPLQEMLQTKDQAW